MASSSVVNPKQFCTLDLDRLGLRCASFKKLIRLESCAQAVRLCLNLLISAINAYVSHNIPSKRQNLAWLSNGYRRLWKLTVLWHCKSDVKDVTSQIPTFSRFLRFIKRFCDHVPYTSPKQRLACIFLHLRLSSRCSYNKSNPVVNLNLRICRIQHMRPSVY